MNKNKLPKYMLISFFYNELNQEERGKVELYLSQNPDERKKLEEWSQAQNALGHLKDKAVVPTPFFDSRILKKNKIGKNSVFRWGLGIAATLIIGVIVSNIFGLSFKFYPEELIITFNPRDNSNSITLSQKEVRTMIQSAILDNNREFQKSWMNDMQNQLDGDNYLRRSEVNILLKDAYSINGRKVNELEAKLKEKYMTLLNQYFENTAIDQKEHTEELFIKFAEYLREQRNQDLKILQSRLNTVEQNTDQFKEQTELIISSLFSISETPQDGTLQ